MAVNEVFRNADHLTLPVPAGTVAGDPVHIGGTLPGVAVTSRDADGNATVWLKGVFSLTVTGVTAVGTAVYIDSSGDLSVTATDNDLFGYALAVKTADAAVIPVRIAQV